MAFQALINPDSYAAKSKKNLKFVANVLKNQELQPLLKTKMSRLCFLDLRECGCYLRNQRTLTVAFRSHELQPIQTQYLPQRHSELLNCQ